MSLGSSGPAKPSALRSSNLTPVIVPGPSVFIGGVKGSVTDASGSLPILTKLILSPSAKLITGSGVICLKPAP